jgi:hypothetical protein
MRQLKQILGQKEITNYQLRITNWELTITNWELRIINYGLRIINYGLRIKQIFHLPLPDGDWPFRRVLRCG